MTVDFLSSSNAFSSFVNMFESVRVSLAQCREQFNSKNILLTKSQKFSFFVFFMEVQSHFLPGKKQSHKTFVILPRATLTNSLITSTCQSICCWRQSSDSLPGNIRREKQQQSFSVWSGNGGDEGGEWSSTVMKEKH